MLLCLSSGHSRRYREDILRCAGLPSGALIQFRYDQRHLGPGINLLIQNGTITGSEVLISYCDQSAKDKEPEMVPCRYALVNSFESAGTTVSAKLRLIDHAFSEHISAFNAELHQLSAGLVPKRIGGKITGCYFTELNSEPRALLKTPNPDNWQKLIDQLAQRTDFQIYETFLLVRSLVKDSTKPITINAAGELLLSPGTRYTAKLYQYHPTKTPGAVKLEMKTVSNRIHFTSDSILSLDSRYDHKEFGFETTAEVDGEESTIKIIQKDNANEDATVELDLKFKIASGLTRAIAYAAIAAVLLAAPHFTSILSNKSFGTSKATALLLVAAVSSVCAGLLAVFKIRRIL